MLWLKRLKRSSGLNSLYFFPIFDNNLNNFNNNYDVPITADITMDSNWNTQCQLESNQDNTYVPHAHTHGHNSTNHCLLSSDTSYTGIGASRIESFVGPEVAQGRYPQESATRVTSTGNVTLPAPQSSGRDTRTGHGSYVEELHERTARQSEHVLDFAL